MRLALFAPARPRRRASFALAAVPVLAVAAVGASHVLSPDDVAPVVAADTPYTITGHGHGHGRGMGQWGAYGYAKNEGWAAERILSHYYGGTTLDAAPGAAITVRLVGQDDRQLDVYSDAGGSVAGRPLAPGEAAHLQPTPGGGANVVVTQGCGGEVLWQAQTDHPWVDPVDLAPDRPADQHLRLCDGSASYRGSLGVALDGTAPRVVNSVDLDDYLLAVVPAESRPDWADTGGAEALRAQAIAARSYASTENRTSYADTCDTQDCQVYGGSGAEDPRTTDAVRSTSRSVLVRDGAPVKAEFSASTGGWTAGGDFPAVEDRGDTESPHHDWVVATTAGEIASAFGVGELHDVVAVRNGSGADGGRVTTLKVTGSDGEVEVGGIEARRALDLRSDWFTITEGAVAPPTVAEPEPELNSPGNNVGGPVSPVDEKYRELGGAASTLGAPLGPQMMLPNEAGVFRLYTGGVIIWTQSLGAQVVDSSVLREWIPDGTGSAGDAGEPSGEEPVEG
ncbi:SpoIID/LytB domain-containing protein [Rhodococcus rhodnii]|nr:SpoIID/LytB domain-containing protein [Rhodococcus rhodnii]TXG89515.1 SpoIID/LytB domain-containing protein [Rhodococcus rhodnii]